MQIVNVGNVIAITDPMDLMIGDLVKRFAEIAVSDSFLRL